MLSSKEVSTWQAQGGLRRVPLFAVMPTFLPDDILIIRISREALRFLALYSDHLHQRSHFELHSSSSRIISVQVSEAEKDKRQDFQATPAPVLSRQSFLELCKAPPLQKGLIGVSRLASPSYSPLTEEEAPRAGTLLGLDAEFVAFSPPTKSLQGCVASTEKRSERMN